MKPRLWVAILIFTACTAFAVGWHIEYRRTRNRTTGVPGRPIGKAQSTLGAPECGSNSPDDHWDTAQIFDYQPVQTLYMVEWQHCASDIQARRVRVTDSD